jgi:hypothetical protein
VTRAGPAAGTLLGPLGAGDDAVDGFVGDETVALGVGVLAPEVSVSTLGVDVFPAELRALVEACRSWDDQDHAAKAAKTAMSSDAEMSNVLRLTVVTGDLGNLRVLSPALVRPRLPDPAVEISSVHANVTDRAVRESKLCTTCRGKEQLNRHVWHLQIGNEIPITPPGIRKVTLSLSNCPVSRHRFRHNQQSVLYQSSPRAPTTAGLRSSFDQMAVIIARMD